MLNNVKKMFMEKDEHINKLQKHNRRAVNQAARRTKEVNKLKGILKEKENDILQKEISIRSLSGACNDIKAEKAALQKEFIELKNQNKMVESTQKRLVEQVKENEELQLKFNKKVKKWNIKIRYWMK
eukprot:UN10133